ncbi:MAG: peptidoglycan DD-metalloendopeptidase family protein [Succinivibrio sp.]
MIKFTAMINIKVTKHSRFDDYIAIERETGAIAIPGRHVLGIFSIGVISFLLALPFGQLVPENNSPLTAFTKGQEQQAQRYELAYLKNDERIAEKNLEITTTEGSQENYDDEIVPEALLANDATEFKEPEVPPAPQITTPAEPLREKFVAKNEPAIEVEQKEKSKEFISNILSPSNIPNTITKPVEPRGKWYEQTVRSGDSLYKIFNYLNLDKKDYKLITFAGRNENLDLQVNAKILFLVDSKNILLEMAIPTSQNKQLRFIRDEATGNFTVTKEDRLAQLTDKQKAEIVDANTMPGFVEAQENREKELLARREKALKEKEAQEKAKLESMMAKGNSEPVIVPEKRTVKVDPKTRPRLIIGSINKKESFDRAAIRLGLTRSEITSIKNQYTGKIDFKKLKAGDSFRVLFNGIGTSAAMTAVEINSSEYGEVTLFRHPQSHIFYEEDGYNPTTGAFRRFPITGPVKVNSQFNLNRFHPIKRKIRPHYGVDFKLSIGTPIYAPADGVVTYASYMRGGGYTVIIKHKNGYTTVYMHLSKFDVKKGDTVHIGQMIARSGNTGYSTGPHLHYEVHVNGRAVDPLKVDLPSGSPATAQRLKEAFRNTVFILKTELYQSSLAQTKN